MIRTALRIAPILTIAAAASSDGRAQEAFVRKSADVPRIAETVRIDGRLDDMAWASATRIADVTQWAPGNGTPPTEPTEFLLLRDDDNLYIGMRFRDAQPERIRRSQLVQGQAVFNDDYAQVLLDPYDTRHSGYIFYVNPNGVRRDGLSLGGNAYNMDWDGIWEAAAQIDADGWTAEMALPFKTLAFYPANDAWGVNLLRSIRRKREELAWSHRDRSILMDVTGEIRGFRGVRQGAGLDVVPSLGVTERTRFAANESDVASKPSLDAFWRVTPALTASLTLNTDFSATEVDDRQVNLTRFSLFFPEKRDFFLDNAEVFEFGSLQQNGRPFFSRTIGLSAAGQPIDLDAGAKLAGRIGRYTVGALAVRQEEFASLEAKDLFVARGYANLTDRTRIGGIFTSGNPSGARDNRVYGLDFDRRVRVGARGEMLETRLWYQRSETDGLDGDDAAFGAELAWPNDRIDAALGFTELQENFLPALGFVNRVGIREHDARAQYRHRFEGGPLRSWTGGVDLEEITGRDGDLQTRRFVVTPLSIDTQPGDQLFFDLIRSTEILARPFALPGALLVRPGRYDFDRLRLNVASAGFREISVTADLETGDFYDGERLDTRVTLAWRPNPHLFVNALYQTNDVELPDGSFTARIYSLTGNVAFNVRWAWLNVLQYDNVSRRLGLNSRLRWLPVAGQSMYFVVNYDWREDPFDGELDRFQRETTLKLSYTFRY
jgi:hypothetical protein